MGEAIFPAAITEQLSSWAQDQPPTYENMERHAAMLTTVIYCMMAEMLSPDMVYLACAHARSVLVKELGYPPEVVQRCLEQLKTQGQRFRERSVWVQTVGTVGTIH